ncbi:MAG: GGDEF domain-containing protein [Lachnospiraceae bacterium]|nr:GGDEF domain-containing protein [Lachnospiraceae bacterium]
MSGHLAGDHTIRIVADLISGLFRKSDLIGRIGGDEYVVLMSDVPSKDTVRNKINELIQLMKYKPNLTISENVSLSVGYAFNNRTKISYQDLFHQADEALYMAKEEGKARSREYGVSPISVNDDDKPVVLLMSRNRSVCSLVQALMPIRVRVIEALAPADLETLGKKTNNNPVLMYVDTAENDEQVAAIWSAINEQEWLKEVPAFAICEEGNMSQFRAAMAAGAEDILSYPLESAAFKRRTIKQLQKLGIIDSI